MIEVNTLDAAVQAGKNINDQNIVPLIKISNKDSLNFDVLRHLFNSLPLPYDIEEDEPKPDEDVEVNYSFFLSQNFQFFSVILMILIILMITVYFKEPS